MNSFMTWELLATWGGAVLAVTILTQVAKALFPIAGKGAVYTSLILAEAVCISAILATKGYSLQNAGLAVLNGIFVWATASGIYDRTQAAKK